MNNTLSILVCSACGYRASADFVNMWDYCPDCKATPFVENGTGEVSFGKFTPTEAPQFSDTLRDMVANGYEAPAMSRELARDLADAAGLAGLKPENAKRAAGYVEMTDEELLTLEHELALVPVSVRPEEYNDVAVAVFARHLRTIPLTLEQRMIANERVSK